MPTKKAETIKPKDPQTLQDLERHKGRLSKAFDFVYSDELRQAAIKWVKELEKDEDYVCVGKRWRKDIEIENWTDGHVMTKGIIHWIKEFFNLTEEDFK